ncbi:MAG: hypothetical protein M3360_07450 [Actinomycetota bacterium]|nr:hypothetical protein [Actinomycetota bacterium]
MGALRIRASRPERGPTAMPGTRLEAFHAASGTGAPERKGAMAREVGRSIALLAVTGLSVGGGLSMVVVAIHVLGR